jgi:hypothetical protein
MAAVLFLGWCKTIAAINTQSTKNGLPSAALSTSHMQDGL